jgi:hypothetical protein
VLDTGHNVPQEDPRGFAQAVIDASTSRADRERDL